MTDRSTEHRSTEHRRAIARTITSLGHAHRPGTIFCDLVEASAVAIANAVDPPQREAREARYLAIMDRYAPAERDAFPSMLAELVLALDEGPTDVLGPIFHDLELHNERQGQFFTPFPLCQMMASMTIGDRAVLDPIIAARGYVTISEPACGSGAMVIAAAEAVARAGLNYHTQMHATAVDVDPLCVHMAYVQLALLHIPAIVIQGNSLSLEERAHWVTPAHVLGGWSARLARESEPAAPALPPVPAIEPAAAVPAPAQLALF